MDFTRHLLQKLKIADLVEIAEYVDIKHPQKLKKPALVQSIYDRQFQFPEPQRLMLVEMFVIKKLNTSIQQLVTEMDKKYRPSRITGRVRLYNKAMGIFRWGFSTDMIVAGILYL